MSHPSSSPIRRYIEGGALFLGTTSLVTASLVGAGTAYAGENNGQGGGGSHTSAAPKSAGNSSGGSSDTGAGGGASEHAQSSQARGSGGNGGGSANAGGNGGGSENAGGNASSNAGGNGGGSDNAGGDNASSNAGGNGGGSESSNAGGNSGNGGSDATDRPGNNGTIKIDRIPEDDTHPNNQPHVGCEFGVDLYNYGEGESFYADLFFRSHSPTAGALAEDYTDRVANGEDGPGGGTDHDYAETYELPLTGDPHPKQGYHVKLTVETDDSQSLGAGVKHKVFWVEPCEDDDNNPPDDDNNPPDDDNNPPDDDNNPPDDDNNPPDDVVTPPGDNVTPPGDNVTPPDETVVSGPPITGTPPRVTPRNVTPPTVDTPERRTPQQAPVESEAPAAEVPTAVAAGYAGDDEVPGGELAALFGASGLLAGLGAWLTRRRKGVKA